MRLHKPISVKLWEEALDPVEEDYFNDPPIDVKVPDPNTLLMYYLIDHQLKGEQRDIVDAFLAGKTFHNMKITEKKWRYHLSKAIKIIKQQVVDTEHQSRLKLDFNRRNYEHTII